MRLSGSDSGFEPPPSPTSLALCTWGESTTTTGPANGAARLVTLLWKIGRAVLGIVMVPSNPVGQLQERREMRRAVCEQRKAGFAKKRKITLRRCPRPRRY